MLRTIHLQPLRQAAAVLGSLALVTLAGSACGQTDNAWRALTLKSKITNVQPMTGIVLWTTNPQAAAAPIQLEFAYLRYDEVVQAKDSYDWSAVDKLLQEVAARKHQLILRWHDTYVGQPNGLPQYLQELPDYKGTFGKSEGKRTGFPDWSHPQAQTFLLEFFTKFAERYDRDPRLAFVQVGFGLWSEYHIYDGPFHLGKTFPSKEYQAVFARHLASQLAFTPWMISVDAGDSERAPYVEDRELLQLRFGLFDDSFNHARHAQENEPNWRALGWNRWQAAPVGGEFSFFQSVDQKRALAAQGAHGIPFETHAAKFHITFMIGDDQPKYQPEPRLRQASMACGYRFRVRELRSNETTTEATIINTGIAPIYYDAYPSMKGIRSRDSLKHLLPGQSKLFRIPAPDRRVTLASSVIDWSQVSASSSKRVLEYFAEQMRNRPAIVHRI